MKWWLLLLLCVLVLEEVWAVRAEPLLSSQDADPPSPDDSSPSQQQPAADTTPRRLFTPGAFAGEYAKLCSLKSVKILKQDQNTGYNTDDVLKHVGKYCGAGAPTQINDDEMQLPGVEGIVQWRTRQMFLPANTHFFSCSDSRANYALMGTPGGDIGEVILAFSAVEKLKGLILEEQQINGMLQDLVRFLIDQGRPYLYMHSDKKALEAWKQAARVSDARNPRTVLERTSLLQRAVQPDHIGCHHLRNILQKPDEFGVRFELAASLITAFLNVYFDPANHLRRNLLYIILDGDMADEAVLQVDSPKQCAPGSPLVVPTETVDGASHSIAVNHYTAVQYFRQQLTQFLCPLFNLHPKDVLLEMNQRGESNMMRTFKASSAGKPSYVARFEPMRYN
eukprot:GILJ01001099.1.p1 GENE.GILJ01001099.1~~GILJ01001099.1.p1  ORF type:complete len:394 (-),score=54.99 GILJ01001099.1:203-1384(-)